MSTEVVRSIRFVRIPAYGTSCVAACVLIDAANSRDAGANLTFRIHAGWAAESVDVARAIVAADQDAQHLIAADGDYLANGPVVEFSSLTGREQAAVTAMLGQAEERRRKPLTIEDLPAKAEPQLHALATGKLTRWAPDLWRKGAAAITFPVGGCLTGRFETIRARYKLERMGLPQVLTIVREATRFVLCLPDGRRAQLEDCGIEMFQDFVPAVELRLAA